MSVLRRLSNSGVREERAIQSFPWSGMLTGYLSSYGSTYTYQGHQEPLLVERSMQVVAVYACLRVISNSISTLPLYLYEESDGLRERTDGSDRTSRLLGRYPHPRIPAGEFYGLIGAHLAGWGNAFIWKGRQADGGPVTSLFPVLPSQVSVTLLEDATPEYTVTMVNGERKVTQKDVLHIRGFGVDGIVGMSPIGVARKAIESMEAEEEYRVNLLRNDARVSGILSTEQTLSPEAATRLKAQWEAAHGGPKKAGGTAVLEAGMKWQQMALSTEDMQFIEQRQYSVAEIARLFGVPPSMINAETADSMTYATVESQGLAFIRDCLMPYLRRIEQALDADPDLVPARLVPEFHVDSLMRAEAGSRATFYSQMIASGVMTVDEARKAENLPPVENTDDVVPDDAPSTDDTENEVDG